MEARRLSRRILAPKTWKHWLFLIFLGLSTSSVLGLLSYIMASPNFNLSWKGGMAIAVTIGVFVLNALTSLPAEIVFLGGTAALFVSGILTEQDALAGFSNPGMITVAVLYIVVTGLSQTGGMNWISQRVLGLPKGQNAALLRLMSPVMGMSAFLNNTPVVAMFIPVVSDWSRKLRISPSKLMIPLSYAAIFGGICTLIGTSTNLVVNGLLIANTDLPGLKLFDIALVGFPCAIAGMIYLFLTSSWLLPNRKPVISDTEDVRQYTVEMMVSNASPLADKTIEKAGLRNLPGLYLVEIVRDQLIFPAVSPQEILREGDRLVFIGTIDSMVDLHRLRGLQPATDQVFKLDTPRSNRCLIEAVVSNTCPMLGKTIREGKFRTQYNAVVLAVARNGERLKGKIGSIRLKAGDTLLLEANANFLSQQRISNDFYLVNGIPDSEPIRHEKAPLAMIILLGMILLSSLGVMSMLKAAILAAVVTIATGCCSSIKALRNIEWSVLLVIGSALSIGKALETTGAAAAIASTMIQFSGDNPWLALAIIYAATNLLTEAITNNAAAALIFPIALALSQNLGVSFMPFAIAIMIAASASFSTPIGYQTNLMVYGPGGYKFTDFMRVGIPLNILFWLITITLTPLFYPFS
ncbi:SLC13 family permease [Waterburya agarophytonicola K14]|uniref:SLC13 family permease n=1 Tax=Waterburya agarophytonicola KI4 TaxID=2874699 RepID=A0A964FHW6_9CYAN|nr:SLC13 family permease [Waterburya agarophytonicola]MCC0179441.1 SLC13 family permease [Waterburya agarophytonicola KI4]